MVGVRIRKWLVVAAAVAAALVLAALLAVHTPLVRGRALAWGSAFVKRHHLELAAGNLSYNVLTRRITLSDVRLAAEGFTDHPFLVARRIEVTLPWSVYQRFSIAHLEIDQGVVDVVRDANNVVNLPPGSNAPTPERPRRLVINALTLNGLDVQYEDQVRDWGVKVARIESALRNSAPGTTGEFGVRGGTTFRLRDRVMTLAPFETVMTFDGSNVTLEHARLSSPEIDAFLSGPITRVLDSPSLELSLKGRVNLDQAIQWVPPPPVPVAGQATIDGSITGPAHNFIVDLSVHSTALDVGRERQLTLAGPVRVTFDAFSGHDLTIAPRSGGSLRANFSVPWGPGAVSTADANWTGVDSAAALRMADVDPWAIGATVDGHGTFEFGEPRRFTIRNRSRGHSGSGVVPMSGTINATIVGDDYRYDHDHSFPGFDFEGQMSGHIGRDDALASTLNGPAHARVSDVAEAARNVQTLGFPVAEIMFRTHGAVDAPMTLGGSYRFPDVDITVAGDAVEFPLLGRARASAHVVADTTSASISSIRLHRGTSAISGDVQANITARTWTGTLHGEAPNAIELQADVPEWWRVAGRLSADAKLGGTFDQFELDSTITGSTLQVAGQLFDRATARALVTADAIDVSSIEAHQGAGYLAGRGRFGWESGAYEASVKGDRLTWTGSVLSPNDTQALFAAQFDGAGTIKAPKGRATLDFVLTGGTAGAFVGAGAATADLLGDHAHIVTRLPQLGALVSVDISTSTPYDYRAAAQLDRFELTRLSPFMGAIATEVLGFANGTITASGRLTDDKDRLAVVNVTELDAGVGGVPVSLLSPLTATLRGDDVAMNDLVARVGSGRLTAAGEWNTRRDGNVRAQFAGDFRDAVRLGKAFGVPVSFDGAGPMQITVQSNGSRTGTIGTLAITSGTFGWVNAPAAVEDVTVNASLNGEQLTVTRLSGKVATGGIIGSFSATGAARVAEASLAAVDGALVLDAARFTFSGIPVAQQRRSRFELAKGRLSLADVSWAVAGNPLVFGGSINLAPENSPLDVSVKGVVDLRILSALTSAVAFDGNADVDARIEGTASTPLLDGRITLDDAEIAMSEPRVVFSDVNGPIELDGRRAVFDGVRGLANGGALALDGAVEFADRTLSGGLLNILAQGVAVELVKGLRSEVDALVSFRPDSRSPSLTGDVRLAQSAYTATITLAALARQAALPLAIGPAVDRPYLDRLLLNLAVTTADDIVVDNNYGRLFGEASVRVAGTVAQPGVEGRVTLREDGQVFLAGRTFRVTRGDISFTDRRRIHPEFNIAAETNLGGGLGNVTLTLTGSLDRPTIDLTSENGSLTAGEIAASLVGSTNTETALTLLSADLLGVTGRAIGLDAFRVERGDFADRDFRDYQEDPTLIVNNRTDPTTRLTVGKRLSDNVEFTVSQNLRENGKATFIVSYFPRRNVELRALSRDSGTISVGIRHQITFGNGASTPASERRARPSIGSVTLSGVDGVRAADARKLIGLGPGDRFDFLALQRDVDRVRQFFHAQGFLEARVRTRRAEPADGGALAVEFIINRGPRTVLQFDGMAPPTELVAELEQAWHNNVFDQFLIEDLTYRVRRHLVTGGDLGSVVVGLIDRPDLETKRLRIEVTPGVPVTGREIRFSGNAAVDSTRLHAAIADAGVEMEAWLDRAVVERTLLQVYNEAGFLKAAVTGRPVEIDGTIGVLGIDITEGPRAQITDVQWAGVGRSRLPEIQKAAAFTVPAPLVAANVAEARRRIEDYYRHHGFTGAAIDVEPAIALDDTVTLTVSASEGVQQVLDSVELTGNEVTHGAVLTEALRFELGSPVDLDEWARARKRLYDTSVFRLVDIAAVATGNPANGVQRVKALVSVEEIPAWSFRYGFQLEGERRAELDEFTSTGNAGVVAELRNPNLFGHALTGGVFGMYQRDRQDATVFLATSRLFGWRARSSLYSFSARDQLRDDSGNVQTLTNRQGISVDQRWHPGGLQIVYGYRFERNHTLIPKSANDVIPFDIVANLAKLSTAIVFDGRDDPIDSRKGLFSSASFDQAALFLGSDVVNRKLLLQQFAFVPLGRLVLASRAQVGFAFGRDALSYTDRFRAGGATSVRGYGEESLGPRDAANLPNGGDRLVILNQEARFPIYRWANGVAFVDAGNIFAKGEDWSGLKVGYGFGLRFDTPVGLIRGDVGFPASTLPAARIRSTRWYFGFGHVF